MEGEEVKVFSRDAWREFRSESYWSIAGWVGEIYWGMEGFEESLELVRSGVWLNFGI